MDNWGLGSENIPQIRSQVSDQSQRLQEVSSMLPWLQPFIHFTISVRTDIVHNLDLIWRHMITFSCCGAGADIWRRILLQIYNCFVVDILIFFRNTTYFSFDMTNSTCNLTITNIWCHSRNTNFDIKNEQFSFLILWT